MSETTTNYLELYEPYIDFVKLTETDQFWNFCCPLHDDQHPSAAISKATGVFVCMAGCGSFRPAQFIHKMTGLDLGECYVVVDNFRQSNNLSKGDNNFSAHVPPPNPRWDELAKQARFNMELGPEDIQNLSESDTPAMRALIANRDHLLIDYCESRGIDLQTLKDLGVGFLPANDTNWNQDSLVFIYTYAGRVVGLRYRNIAGQKGGPAGTYFTLFGIDELDRNPETVVIMEGESDRVLAHQILGRFDPDILVISLPTGKFRFEWVRELEGVPNKILVPQLDDVSQKMALEAQKLVPDLRIVQLQMRRRQIGKDLCDWRRYNSDNAFYELIQLAVSRSAKRVITTKEFEDIAVQEEDWIIQDFLARQQLCIIAGHPKGYKTWLALNLARCGLLPGSLLYGIPGIQNVTEKPLKTIFIQEEGSIRKFYERSSKVLDSTTWYENCRWGLHLGFKFDQLDWVDRLSKWIDESKPDLLFVDPFARTYTQDENQASAEMAAVWNNIALLLTRHNTMSIIILHHFNKGSTILDKWGALRGSSRAAAEADLGIFTEQRPRRDGRGPRIVIEGRDIESPTVGDTEMIMLNFDKLTGLIILDQGK